jgi:hypothetical protein
MAPLHVLRTAVSRLWAYAFITLTIIVFFFQKTKTTRRAEMVAVFYPTLLALAAAHVRLTHVRLPMGGMSATAPIVTRRHIAMAAPRGRGPPPPEHMINEFIKQPELRVVGEPEQPDMPDIQLGVMSRSDALARAREEGVDLVCISPGASPPVCKIIDYGRFRFQAEKKKKMIKKVRARVRTEVRARPGGRRQLLFRRAAGPMTAPPSRPARGA